MEVQRREYAPLFDMIRTMIDFINGVACEGEEISLVSGSGSELNFNHADDILQSGWAQPSGALVPKSALALFHHHFTRRGVFLQD